MTKYKQIVALNNNLYCVFKQAKGADIEATNIIGIVIDDEGYESVEPLVLMDGFYQPVTDVGNYYYTYYNMTAADNAVLELLNEIKLQSS